MVDRIFDSAFHKQYVGGEGEVVEKTSHVLDASPRIIGTTEEEVLAEYRKYIGDPEAELPEEIKKTLHY